MKAKNLFILLIVGVVICGGAVCLYNNQKTTIGSKNQDDGVAAMASGDNLVAGLNDESLEKIVAIEVEKGGETLSMAMGDDKVWRVTSAGGYKADPTKVVGLAMNLMACVVSDSMTKKETKYENFGVEGETGTNGSVKLSDAQGKVVASLIIGDERSAPGDAPAAGQRPRSGGRFYRTGDDPYVYLAQDSMSSLDVALRSWVETKVVEVKSEDIVSVSINHGSTETLALSWKSGSAELSPVDEGLQLKTSEAGSVQRALSNVTLNNVVTVDSDEAKLLDFTTSYTATSKDGTVYHAAIAEAAGKRFLKLSADYGEMFLTASDSATTQSTATATIQAEMAKNRVPEFNKTHAPWVYEIATWAAGNLTKKRSELMEEIPEAEPVETPVGMPGTVGPMPPMSGMPSMSIPTEALDVKTTATESIPVDVLDAKTTATE